MDPTLQPEPELGPTLSLFRSRTRTLTRTLSLTVTRHGTVTHSYSPLPTTTTTTTTTIFRLYEIKAGETLPGSGERWDFLRNGQVPAPPSSGPRMAGLVSAMMSPNPLARPTADNILQARTCAPTHP